MKFLFVGSKANLDLNKIGGIENTIKELIFFLLKHKYKVYVYIIEDRETSISEM